MEYILKKLKEAKIPKKNIEIGKQFLLKNADAKVLDELEFYDFSLAFKLVAPINRGLNELNKDEYNKFLIYMYKMGYGTVNRLFYSITYNVDDDNEVKAIKTLIRSAAITKGTDFFEDAITRNFNDYKYALEIIEKEKNKIVDYYENKLVMYVSYFVGKYKADEQNNEDTTIPYYMRKPTTINILEEDRLMLEDYENTLIESIKKYNLVGLSDEKKTEIVEALRNSSNKKEMMLACRGAKLSKVNFLKYAFANFRISPILKNVVQLALCISEYDALLCMKNNDVRGDFSIRAGHFDEEFGIDPNSLLDFALGVKNDYILRVQFIKNKNLFLEFYKKSNYSFGEMMLNIIGEIDEKLKTEIIENGKNTLRDKLVKSLILQLGYNDEINGFFFGDKTLEDIYKIEEKISSQNYYYKFTDWIDAVNNYIKRYGFDEFVEKSIVMSVLIGNRFGFVSLLLGESGSYIGQVVELDRIKKVYDALDSMNLDAEHIVKTQGYVQSNFSLSEINKEKINNFLKMYFKNKLEKERDVYVKALYNAGVDEKCFILSVYEKDINNYKNEILSYFNDKSVVIKRELINIISKHKEYREDMIKKLSSKKGSERELAATILMKYESEEDIKAVIKAYENEKSEKIKLSMEKILGDKLEVKTVDSVKKVETTIEDIVQKLHKANKKRTFEWAYETPFTKVHFEDGTECSDEYMQAIMLAYASVNPAGVSTTAMKLTEKLVKDELAIFVNELFDKWLEKGAEAKKRWVLYMASIHGGRDIIKKLNDNIKEWPLVARGAIAADAVYALSLNPEPEAILLVDGFARKFKFKQVKSAASNALEFAANQLGISKAELEDRIVPTLGFDNSMERIFDYGARTFKVILTQTLELEVYDENNKKLKNMPAPGKKDDEVIAKESNAEFKNLKKQLKTVAESQKERLNYALSVNRTWTVNKWKELFVNNPIMHQFATGLIWGVYNNNELSVTFRYMEDGTFNTVDEEEYELEDNKDRVIGLVHPIELEKDTITAWKEQLEDYEIKQPIEQLDREIFEVSEEEKTSKELTRYAGFIMSDYTIIGKLTKLGWYKGSVQDAGYFKEFYREDGEYGAELKFEGCSVTPYGEDTTIYATRFYKAGNVARGSYVYDEVTDEKAITLCDIPKRYFSEIVLQLKQLTNGCEDRVEY